MTFQVGWPGLSRAIALSVVLTSAFWVALGAWLFHGHIAADRHGDPAATKPSTQGPAGRLGLLDGLTGGAPASAPSQTRPPVLAPSPVRVGSLAIPVAGVPATGLVDTFSQARAEGARRHDAIDIMASEGAPVLAAAGGRVEKMFLSEEGGNTIYVRSPDRRLIYYYAHLAGYDPALREGSRVNVGQRLGTVGHTGNADPAAPHLHFAVWSADPSKGWSQDGAAINPYPLLTGRPARQTQVPAVLPRAGR
ncbi:murein DD-endopeptidase MepM/ murein hydrolase activator NlpD [Novosphingobium chloroacetimidivorans]|uniref:Murein DD-endopeptidase MepM/ murein hydrolase activator NlpD n=1 Tax=Novosphingobium chloroacetimidivorans TaxID=1428314 RepID=A0A7W7K929_9SPHN|nr:M23 family metallopeptidase [Novosphingobium chloroacetimidivorans]MBB4858181.1 murein DD-endopeptidase MepM/ murein hydrolase activator NlpD [Novosphingobium chloroacetimidivorans]